MSEFTTSKVVRFGHVDPAGIAYFPRIYEFLHEAFEELWERHVGARYDRLILERRLGFPLVHSQVDFRGPLHFGDRALVRLDANQGWTPKQAVSVLRELEDSGVRLELVEQPVIGEDIDGMKYVTDRVHTPVMADESSFGPREAIELITGRAADIINIKLMKSTGLREAHKMITVARALDMHVMIGCMTETSCAVSAASQLSPLVDWADLDGNLLISNDIYEGVKVIDGKVTLNELPGIGIKKA